MKRKTILWVGIVGLSYAFASPALADGGRLCYSTGPMENSPAPQSIRAIVKVLNNSRDLTVNVETLVFALNGTKSLLGADSRSVGPQSSDFVPVDLSTAAEWEAQVRLTGPRSGQTLIAVFGIDGSGNLNPSHRVVHSEMQPIPCNQFGPIPVP